MDHRRVVITGIGAISALGTNASQLWENVLAGRSGVGRIRRFVDANLPVTSGGDVVALPFDDPDRDQEIAKLAISEAIATTHVEAANAAFVWATGLDTFQVVAGQLVRRSAGSCFSALASRFGGPKRMIATACASSAQAIGEAFHLVRRGGAEICIAGGSSVMLTPFYLIGFSGLQAIAIDRAGEDPSTACRPFDKSRRGFALGDGAGAVIIESLSSAKRRGVNFISEITGFGVSQDGFDLNRPPLDGSGAAICMRRALEDARLKPDGIDAINAHGTGTLVGDIAEAAAFRNLLGDVWKRIPVSGMKGALGHTMAAAGALEAIVAMQTCATGIVPATVNLNEPDEDCELNHVVGQARSADVRRVMSTSFGMGGQNAALIFERVDHE